MKIFCGTDIIEVSRIKKIIDDKVGEKFLNKIYTEKEIEYCNSKGKNKYEHFAARFAAKEAVFKALSQEYKNDEISYKDIEIDNKENGRPFVNINNMTQPNINVDISLSHIKEYAIANCVVTVGKIGE
ncbi:MAG: holo-ACP synthase [Clostridia bacterium]|nr:holo-ACP synthase [Clostridia bacterium]